jgi:FtsZ-binding cell division protein ZapB
MGWITDIADLVKGLPVSAVLKERLALAQDRFDQLQREADQLKNEAVRLGQEVQRLQQENDALRSEAAELKKRLEEPAALGLVMHRGVYWKRKPAGGYEDVPYCPDCKGVMAKIPPWGPDTIRCKKCSRVAPFHPREVSEVIAEMP